MRACSAAHLGRMGGLHTPPTPSQGMQLPLNHTLTHKEVAMRKLLENAAQRAILYLENLESRAVAPSPESILKLSVLDEHLPKEPRAPEKVLNQLDEICSAATMAMAGPRFFGFVIGGSMPFPPAANCRA